MVRTNRISSDCFHEVSLNSLERGSLGSLGLNEYSIDKKLRAVLDNLHEDCSAAISLRMAMVAAMGRLSSSAARL